MYMLAADDGTCMCHVILPEYVMVESMLLSAGGAHLPHIACIAGNVTPYNNKRKEHENNRQVSRDIIKAPIVPETFL